MAVNRTGLEVDKAKSKGKVEEEEVVVVFTRKNRGGSAQHATRATPTQEVCWTRGTRRKTAEAGVRDETSGWM